VRPVYPANSFKRIANEPDLRLELSLIVDMLKLATATVAKVLATRFPSRRRRLEYSINCPSGEVLLSFGNSNTQPVTGRGEGNKDREPVVARYGIAAVSQPLGCHVDDVAYSEQGVGHDLTITDYR